MQARQAGVRPPPRIKIVRIPATTATSRLALVLSRLPSWKPVRAWHVHHGSVEKRLRDSRSAGAGSPLLSTTVPSVGRLAAVQADSERHLLLSCPGIERLPPNHSNLS